MRIICPTCASHYEVDADAIGANGQLVRCLQCREVWLVKRTEHDALPALSAPDRARPIGPSEQAPDVGPAREPIDFHRARARLRPRIDAIALGSEARGTLGVLVACVLTLGGVMAALGERTAIVRHVPATSVLYAAIGLPVNTQGLALRGVRSALVAEGDKTVLTLQGEITNLRDEATSVPGLTMVVRGAGQAPLYTWTASSPKSKLAKGETVEFRSRLAAPPPQGQDVRVSFADASLP